MLHLPHFLQEPLRRGKIETETEETDTFVWHLLPLHWTVVKRLEVLAHLGSYIPCKAASISFVPRL